METEYKSYKLKRKINPVMKCCCIGIGMFFAVMLTSFIWLPKEKEKFQVTSFNVPITEPNTKRVLTLVRWDYSEKDKEMEVQFRIENQSYDGRNEYVWSAADRYRGALAVETVYADTEIIAVKIKKIPASWSTISLRMGFSDSASKGQYLFKIYGDKLSVNAVEHIAVKERNDYYILDFRSTITYYENEIIRLENSIVAARDQIKEVSGTIEKKSEEMKYMTDQELKVAMSNINTLKSMIASYENEIAGCEELIDEYNNRIIKLQEKIKAYQE